MTMSKKSTARYWNGYRAAKRTDYECGLSVVESNLFFGLNGCTSEFIAGYRRYYRFAAKKAGRDFNVFA